MSNGQDLFGSVYERGALVFRQGDPGDTMYIIQSGAVEVTQKKKEGEQVLAILEKGNFFGEMALFQEESRSATVTALRQTRLLPLTRGSLLERVRRDPGVVLHLMEGLSLRIARAGQGLNEAVRKDEELRVAVGESAVEGEYPAPSVAEPTAEASPESEIVSAGESIRRQAHALDGEGVSEWFDAGQSIYREGDPGEALYIILEGSVELTGEAQAVGSLMSRLGPGDFFGDGAVLAGGGIRRSHAFAIERTRLIPLKRDELIERVKGSPELASAILQSLIWRLRHLNAVLADPTASIETLRRNVVPLLKKKKPRISIVSLSTCAGCSAVLLDAQVLAEVLDNAEIVYCPMLMDVDEIPEADVALIDGAVRLKEETEKLEEARAKSRFVAAWGTCAALGGVPAMANSFDLEELIEETYGKTKDTFAYYMSGEGGVDKDTYTEKGVALLRRAYKLDDFVKVDYYLPACPPNPGMLLQLLRELTAKPLHEAHPVVCKECGRLCPVWGDCKLQELAHRYGVATKHEDCARTPVASLRASPGPEKDFRCFVSLGTFCMGFLSKGGCGALCPRHGLPCWGCRGPSEAALKKTGEMGSFEEVVAKTLAERCMMEEDKTKSFIRLLREQGHALLEFDRSYTRSITRIR